MVGAALVRRLRAHGCANLLLRTRAELDLADQDAVHEFMQREQPEVVFLAAAKVGGVHANDTLRADFIYQNLQIEINVIHAAFAAGVTRLLFLGSSCVYPRSCPQPIKEEYLLTGPLEPTNEPYAVAKIAGIKMCESYNRQYGTQYISAMPTNLYGPGDNYDVSGSHVLPALIRKTHEAKMRGDPAVTVWGTGTPRREFLYSDDMAEGCVHLMSLDPLPNNEATGYPIFNLGCGVDLTIRELAELVKKVVGFEGELDFDTGKPDGMSKKLLEVSRMKALGWQATTSLEQGISIAYHDFIRRFPAVSLSNPVFA